MNSFPPEKTQNSKWWLWPLMPFAAFLGAIFGSFLCGLLLWLGMKFSGGYSEDGWYFLYVMPFIGSVVFGFLFSLIAYYVSPTSKFTATTVMVTILGMLLLVNIVFTWFAAQFSTGEQIQATVGSLASFGGAIGGLLHMRDEYPET